MRRHALRMMAVAALLPWVAAGCGDTHRPREKEQQAVRLLGNSAPIVGRPEVDAECLASEGNVTRAAATRAIVEWVGDDSPLRFGDFTLAASDGPNLADGLHTTAKKLADLARACRKMQATIWTSEHPDIAQIRAILGQEDSSREFTVELGNERVPNSAHTFGWLEFVAMRGKVLMLKVDFKASGF